jgi:hypothetical protein
MTLILAAWVAFAAAAPITGTWNMGVQAGHVVPLPLVLAQDGTSLKGTITLPTGQDFNKRVEVQLAGDIVDGELHLSGTFDNGKETETLEIDGKMLEDGTLEGHFDMPGHPHLPWTAERLKERKR